MSQVDFSNTAVLVLAAGNSSRMGQTKQLLPWKNATLIEHAVHTAHSLTDHFQVVLGANAQAITPYVPAGKMSLNKKWKEGMGSSIAQGVTSLEEKYAPEAILIMVMDQPLLELEHYNNLILSYGNHPDKISASSYDQKPGVPAIFPKAFFNELKKLGADFGARKLMKANMSSLVMVETKGELIDLDTPEDYRLASSRLGK